MHACTHTNTHTHVLIGTFLYWCKGSGLCAIGQEWTRKQASTVTWGIDKKKEVRVLQHEKKRNLQLPSQSSWKKFGSANNLQHEGEWGRQEGCEDGTKESARHDSRELMVIVCCQVLPVGVYAYVCVWMCEWFVLRIPKQAWPWNLARSCLTCSEYVFMRFCRHLLCARTQFLCSWYIHSNKHTLYMNRCSRALALIIFAQVHVSLSSPRLQNMHWRILTLTLQCIF